jgi:hypothetical protein
MRLVLLMACVCLLPHHVSAQQEPRVSIFAGVSAQPSDTSFTDVTHFPYNLESGLAEGDYAVQGGTGLDIGGRVHIWRQFGFVQRHRSRWWSLEVPHTSSLVKALCSRSHLPRRIRLTR